MTVILHLSPETEHLLREHAARRGQTLEAYLEVLVRQAEVPPSPAQAEDASVPPSLLDFLEGLPAGPRSGSTWEEIEQNLQKGRQEWEP